MRESVGTISRSDAFAALCVHFSENQSESRSIIEKHGIRLFRTHVIEVKSSEELRNSVLKASQQKNYES